MERPAVFMNGKTHCYQGINSLLTFSIDSMHFQNPASFLLEIDKLMLKIIWKCKGPRVTKFEKELSWKTYAIQF